MSSLQEFLNSNFVDGLESEVVVSDRIRDENGGLLKFSVRAMTGSEFSDLKRKHSTITYKDGKQIVDFDDKGFIESVVVEFTKDPNFKDAKSVEEAGVFSPGEYVNKVLLAGEVLELYRQITVLSGFNKNISELIEEAKN